VNLLIKRWHSLKIFFVVFLNVNVSVIFCSVTSPPLQYTMCTGGEGKYHPSNNDCVEDKREDYRNCFLCSVVHDSSIVHNDTHKHISITYG